MKNVRWLPIFAMVFVCLPVLAQNTDDVALERQRKILSLVDSLIADGREMVLPENRAVILASAGQRLWEIDPKRAQGMFTEAITELIAAQNEADADIRKGRQSELTTGQSTRPGVLRLIAARNADFALKSLYRTRPAIVERAMLDVRAKGNKIRSMAGNDSYLAQNELNLEQWLVALAADQNPEKAAELLRAALKKGVTGEALTLLKKLHAADPAAAAELGTEVVSQLVRKGFMDGSQLDYNLVQTSVGFLQEHLRQRTPSDTSFRFAGGDMKGLADKLIAFFLDRGSQYGYPYTYQIIPIAEKLRPDAVERLRELNQNAPRHGLMRIEDPNYERLIQHETPIEQVLAEAPKLPVELRRNVYNQAANRLAASGDIRAARQVIDDNFSDEAQVNARGNLDWFQFNQLISQGKYADAELLLGEFPEGTRFSGLISLADSIFNRDRVENRNQALAMLSKAGAVIPARPENNNELQQTNQLIAAYSRIEPSEAFRILEGLLPQINELSEAMMVVNSFSGAYNIRRGEGVISTGSPVGIQVDGGLVWGLAQKDFDRAMALVAGLSRREMRAAIKQQMLNSF